MSRIKQIYRLITVIVLLPLMLMGGSCVSEVEHYYKDVTLSNGDKVDVHITLVREGESEYLTAHVDVLSKNRSISAFSVDSISAFSVDVDPKTGLPEKKHLGPAAEILDLVYMPAVEGCGPESCYKFPAIGDSELGVRPVS